MSNYDLNRHKKGDKVKWVFTGIAFFLSFVLIVGLFLQVFGEGKVKPSEWFGNTEQTETDPETENDELSSGGTIIDNVESSGISLMTAVLSEEEYEDYGVSTLAESAYTVTATLNPSSATVREVDWSLAWKNASSTWANGKTVTDYVTVSTATDGALTCTVTNLKAFGEQIILKCTSRDTVANSPSATCTIDYEKAVTSVGIELLGDCSDWDDSETYLSFSAPSSSYTTSYTSGGGPDTLSLNKLNTTYGTGTVTTNNYTETLKIVVNPSYKSAIQSKLGVTVSEYTVDLDATGQTFLMSDVCNTIFGSSSFSTAIKKSKVYSALQPYYSSGQAVFQVVYSRSTALRGTSSFTYNLLCNFSALYTVVSGISLSGNLTF